MTRKEVHEFVKSGVGRLKIQHSYGRGRISEFSSIRDHTYPVVWFETSSMSTELSQNSLPIDKWQINLHIGRLDREDSIPAQYEDILDECDTIAQSLSFLYNSIVSGSSLLRLSSIERTPFIKKNADSITGILLAFTLTAPDTTDQSENCE